MKRPYHHGTLRESFVEAAIAELRENGRDGFSLRRTATRAGVSHAAPAHHFGNADGLLQAVRAEGYRRLVAAMSNRCERIDEPLERLVATGLGYVDHALAEPALFDLMFGSPYDGVEDDDEATSFDMLLAAVTAARGEADDPGPERDFWLAVSASWSLVHGYAQLAAAGRMAYLDELGPDREATLASMLRMALSGIVSR